MMRLTTVMMILALCPAALAGRSGTHHAAPARPAPVRPAAAPPLPPAPEAGQPKREYRPEEWAGPVGEAGKNLDLLGLFAKASHYGGITVKIPGDLQRVPLAPLGLQDLEDRGIELYLKELRFRDLDFTREQNPLWMETHPVLPALMRFATLGASLEARTKLGVIPLGATFRDGALPFDFVFRPDGYDLGVMPERRTPETNLEEVHLQVGGPLTTGFVNTFFRHEVAKLVMKYGVGQTLKMDEKSLFSGASAASFLKMKPDSAGAQAVTGLLDALGGRPPDNR